jgi:hypothetical protein
MRRSRAVAPAVAAVLLALAIPSGADAASDHSCFWLGPISVNKRAAGPERLNGRYFNFPEESATYWLARYRLAPGQRLLLRGRYPHARYESLNSYAQGGTPTFSMPDIRIAPDAGTTNPFLAGARRMAARRGWTVTVVDRQPPPGTSPSNTMYAPSTSAFASELVLRVYEPDRGRDLTGGVGLPVPEIVNADGSRVTTSSSVCGAVNDPDRGLERTVQSIAPSLWQSLTDTPGPDADPATSPALAPPQWERFFNQTFASGVFQQAAGNPRPLAGQDDVGGFYSNRDSRYLLTHLSRRFGKILVIRGRMPRSPRTYDGEPRMEAAQVRFWSLCSGESRVTTYTPDCLADRQVPLDRGRRYTIVVSRKEDRPANARPACGAAWLNWGRRGDAAGRPDYGLLLMRNMLASPGFKQAIQNVQRFGDERRVMGPYFPSSAYSSTAAFEKRGCATASEPFTG